MPDAVPTQPLHELADGVFAWLQPGGETGVANAGVIVDDDGITVVDTLMVRSQWEPFAAAVAELDRPVRRLVLTHAHIDHVGGTKAFPNAAVLRDSAHTSDAARPRCRSRRTRRSCPRSTTSSTTSPRSAPARSPTSSTDAAQLTPASSCCPRPGTPPGDVIVLVADADVCFAGDLCFFGVTPLAFQGDPATWADVLDVVVELADTIVPGHGPVGGERRGAGPAGLPAALRRRGDDPARPVGHLARTGRARRRSTSSAPPLLAAGRDEMPPSMLRAIGLG